MNASKEIYIMVNSPGEIAGWLRPAVKELKMKLPDYKLTAVLLPCVFASGAEQKVISDIKEIEGIVSSERFFSSLLTDSEEHNNSFILHFGGDLAYTALLAKRWRTFFWSYQWSTRLSDRKSCGYFVKTEKDRERLLNKGVIPGKIHITGDLIYDSVMNNLPQDFILPENQDIKTIAFMPGSRNLEVEGLLPFLLKSAYLVKKENPCISFKAIISPFIDMDYFYKKEKLCPFKGFDGFSGVFIDGRFISLEHPEISIELVSRQQYHHMALADMLVSIPGTKTGEAACLEKPMLVIVPLNRTDHIPFVGIIGLLDWIPFIGKAVKGKILKKMSSGFGFAAQPNILAGREVVPEMWGELTPAKIAEKINAMIADKTALLKMKTDLRELYSPFKGASKRLAELFVNSIPLRKKADKPYFSVIICTHNRKELLVGTLNTLAEQDIDPDFYEIIVVDDGSTDGTKERIESLDLPCRLRYIYKDWGGRSATRNIGINQARGEIAVFVDDDIIAPKTFLSELVRYHRRYPWSIVRGPIINITEYENPGTKPEIKDYSRATFCTCNASAPVKALRDIGGFDESFIEYGYEDNEIGRRLIKYGLKRHFNMKAYLYHYKPLSLHDDIDKAIANAKELARSAVIYYKKHPERHSAMSVGLASLEFLKYKSFSTKGRRAERYMNRWQEAADQKDYGKMIYWENKLRKYYYMKTLAEEMKGNPSR